MLFWWHRQLPSELYQRLWPYSGHNPQTLCVANLQLHCEWGWAPLGSNDACWCAYISVPNQYNIDWNHFVLPSCVVVSNIHLKSICGLCKPPLILPTICSCIPCPLAFCSAVQCYPQRLLNFGGNLVIFFIVCVCVVQHNSLNCRPDQDLSHLVSEYKSWRSSFPIKSWSQNPTLWEDKVKITSFLE